MSSNADSDEIRSKVMEIVRASFRPEFLNRLDEIILFHKLLREHMDSIVDIQLARLNNTLSHRKIIVTLSKEAQTFIADKGFDDVYGARPLKRVMVRDIQNPMATMIIDGRVADGSSVNIKLGNNAELEFQVK